MNDIYDQRAHWDELHTRYSGPEHNAEVPCAFAQRFGSWLAGQGVQGRLLELGCGGGADLRYFSGMGRDAVGLDFSCEGLRVAGSKLGRAARLVQGHLAQGLPFADSAFSAVYAHLSLHYFDDKITKSIFAEIHRVIGLNGYFALRVKSVDNESCGRGELLGTDRYLYRGHVRRFFQQEFLDELIAKNTWEKLHNGQQEEKPGYLSVILQKKEQG